MACMLDIPVRILSESGRPSRRADTWQCSDTNGRSPRGVVLFLSAVSAVSVVSFTEMSRDASLNRHFFWPTGIFSAGQAANP
jgi:hypothetical protein